MLRDWKESDIDMFSQMNKDSDVMAYFPKTLTEKETLNLYTKIQTEFDQFGYGLYAVELKSTGEFIGFTGFHWATFESSFTPCIEIGWRLKKESWGKGYATEGAMACLNVGFTQLNFDKIISFTAAINDPSRRVMEKIGLTYVKNFDFPGIDNKHLINHVLFSLDRQSYTDN
nr:GNAT family N-acetyltransferase [Alkalibacterium olivapovliticus]